MKSFKKQIFALGILIISISYYEVIYKPFPFINMTYTNSIEQVNDFSFNDFHSYEFRNIDLSTTVSMSDFQKITWAVEQARNLQDISYGSLLREKESMFDENRSYMNICSENSKILSNLLYELNFPNRIIWMDGHTVVEVYFDQKWVLIDSYGNVVAKNKLGILASLEDVINNYDEMTFHKITNLTYDNLPEYTENNYLNTSPNVYSDQSLFVVLDISSVNSLHIKNRDVMNIINSILGNYSDGVGIGIQFLLNDESKLVGNYGIKVYEKIKFSLQN